MVHMHGRRSLVGMAHEASSLGSGGNDIGDFGAGWVNRVDISSGGVAGVTGSQAWSRGPQMGLQDIGPVAGMMAVGARLGVGLTKVGNRIDIRCVLVGAAGKAVGMGREITGVAVNAFAGTGADTGTGCW